jgi:hypothetical protein
MSDDVSTTAPSSGFLALLGVAVFWSAIAFFVCSSGEVITKQKYYWDDNAGLWGCLLGLGGIGLVSGIGMGLFFRKSQAVGFPAFVRGFDVIGWIGSTIRIAWLLPQHGL